MYKGLVGWSIEIWVKFYYMTILPKKDHFFFLVQAFWGVESESEVCLWCLALEIYICFRIFKLPSISYGENKADIGTSNFLGFDTFYW